MGNFPVTPQKEAQLLNWMQELGISEEEIEENFIRGSGSGGQKINKTSSCVQLIHAKSGTEIRCQLTRSQAMNRYYARKLLCEKLDQKRKGEQSKRSREIAKIRKQKRRRSRKAKEKLKANKQHLAKKKSLRKPPSGE